jgi:hypothetical protein
VLVLWCLLATATATAAAENRAVVFVIDRGLTAEKIELVRKAFKEVEFHEGDRIGVVAYGKTGQVVQSIAGGPSRSRIVPTTEPTNLDAGLETARAMAKRVRGARVFVIVTDGETTTGEVTVVAPRSRSQASLRSAFQRAVDGVAADDAYVFLIDRGLYGGKLEAAKELARERAEALSPNTFLAVIGFDATPQVYVRMQRAANRMRISNDVSRLNSTRNASDTTAALNEAAVMLGKLDDVAQHVVLFGNADKVDGALAKAMTANGIAIEVIDIPGLLGERRKLRMR